MSLLLADRVKETTTTTGTSTLSLGGAVAQFQSFVAGVGNGNTCIYAIAAGNGTDWEIGIGTVTSGSPNTLSRGTILASSNSGSAISLTGTSTVWSDAAAPLINKILNPMSAPGGRLSLQSGAPVMNVDKVGVSTIYYAAYAHGNVPIWKGSWWDHVAIPGNEISMGLDAVTPHVANNALYDVFGLVSAGALVLAAGPAWINTATITVTIATPAVVSWTGHGLSEGAPVVFTTSGALPTGITAGTTYFVGRSPGANSFNFSTSIANAAAGTFVATSGSQSGTHTGTNNTSTRGTGAGTTEITQLNGVWVNKNALTHAWGGASGTTDYGSVAANQAIYLGTFLTTANGQTTMQFQPAAASGGANTIMGLYNAYNRERLTAMSRDSATSWAYATATWRAADNSVSNRITFVDGLGSSPVSGGWQVLMDPASAGYSGATLNSTNTAPQITAQMNFASGAPALWSNASDAWQPQKGANYIQAMEASSGSTTFFGASTSPTRQLNALTISLRM
jgi:hypothetical protein